MAIFRKIHTTFWSDSFISDLKPDQKLFYLYLLTNDRTRQCGIYEITKKHISYDLGYSIDRVSELLGYFIKRGKIRYNEGTCELAVKNWPKYNESTSPKVQSCINKELAVIKDRVLIEYINSIDTQSQQEQEQEQEQDTVDVNSTKNPETTTQPKRKKRDGVSFIPPTLDDVLKYFDEKGYRADIAKKAFDGYSVANWIDSHGSPVLNWKQKMINVWFRPEFLKPASIAEIKSTGLVMNNSKHD